MLRMFELMAAVFVVFDEAVLQEMTRDTDMI